tara:strand:+ start:7642 stop:8583 length:942 start_codon:yes stop_codon:yes gene_type:complete
MKEVDLILSGGGSKFISQLSFVKTLQSSKRIKIRNIYCTSAGSLLAPYIVTNKLEYLEKYYFELPSVESQLNDWNLFTKFITILSKIKFLSFLEMIVRLIYLVFFHGAYKSFNVDILDELDDILTENDKKEFSKIHIATLKLNTGSCEWFNGYKGEKWHWIDAVKASCALMPVVPPVNINGELYADGGVIDVTPIGIVPDDSIDKLIVTYDYLTRSTYNKRLRLGTTIITYLQDLLYSSMAHHNRLLLKNYLTNRVNNNVHVFTSNVQFKSILDFDMSKRKQLYEDGVNNATKYLESLDVDPKINNDSPTKPE